MHVDAKPFLDLVVILECTAASCHHAQLGFPSFIEVLLSLLQFMHEIDTILNIIRIELEKRQTTTQSP